MTMYDKILGGLLGAAIGDAMGAATETRSLEQIKEKFGGLVTDFIAPPEDVFAHGFPVGSVTDDFSLAYCTAQSIVERGGTVDKVTAANALLKWSETPYYVMAGPTTVAAVDRLRGIETPSRYDFLSVDNSKGSNGSAMKISPAALVSGGDEKTAIQNAITICMPTHGNSTALSGACAVSAAIADALKENANVYSMVQAGLRGAKAGEEVGISIGKQLACPSVYKRIQLAVEIALSCGNDLEKCLKELTDIIGSGLSCAEAVPCAFGLLVFTGGNAMQSIIGGVNIGNDTDTVATIVGSMAGTLQSVGAFKKEHMDLIDRVNGYDLSGLAYQLEKVSKK